jgi:hypothetical protein
MEGHLSYLAAPYTHKEHSVMVERFLRINKVAAQLMARGEYIYSPISHTHPLAEAAQLPRHWEFWKGYDRCMLSRSQRLYVLIIDGWMESTGVQAEIEIAKELKIPIIYINEELVTMYSMQDVLYGMKTIAIDFDGVIHGYSRGWQDGSIYDPPKPGTKEALTSLKERGFQLVIFSARNYDRTDRRGGFERNQVKEVTEYLVKHSIPFDRIHTEPTKPNCSLFIDDKAVRWEISWEDTMHKVWRALGHSL